MPRGLNRTDLNTTGVDYKDGTPITLPHEFGNPISEPHDFGNDVTWSPSPAHFGNDVEWAPDPAHYGNIIGGMVLSAPVITPAAGSVFQGQLITLTQGSADFIYYTTNGSTPTPSSTVYSGPFNIDTVSGSIVKAIATQGAHTSTVATSVFSFKAPRVDTITPNTGSAAGGMPVEITGDGFDPDFIDVTLNGVPVQNFNWVDYQTIDAVASNATAGTGDVVVTNSDHKTGTLVAGWTYTAIPLLVAHAVSQGATGVQPAVPTSAVNTTGANWMAMAINSKENQFPGTNDLSAGSPLVWDAVGSDLFLAPMKIATATASAGDVTFTPVTAFDASAAANGWVGKTVVIQGFDLVPAGNNGYFTCTASSTSSVTVTGNPGGQTVAGTSATFLTLSSNIWAEYQPALVNDMGGGNIWFSESPTVGANHRFGEDDRPISGAGQGSSFAISAFSGLAASGTLVNAQAGPEATTDSAVEVTYTPSNPGDLLICIVTGLSLTGPENLIQSNFVITDSYQTGVSTENPIGMAYGYAQDTTPQVIPIWTFGADIGDRAYASIFEFSLA